MCIMPLWRYAYAASTTAATTTTTTTTTTAATTTTATAGSHLRGEGSKLRPKSRIGHFCPDHIFCSTFGIHSAKLIAASSRKKPENHFFAPT